MRPLTIAVLMDLPAEHDYHRATLAAVAHAAAVVCSARAIVVRTDAIGGRTADALGDAVVVGPGSPYRDPDAALEVIGSAREREVALVGTWGGFQHVLVEHARSLAGIRDASHAEYGTGGTPVITALACSLQGEEITVELTPGSFLARLYGKVRAHELTTCDYGLAPVMQHLAAEHGMQIAATNDTGEVRAVERPGHRFFSGTLYQPQLRSTPNRPHPVFVGLLRAAITAI